MINIIVVIVALYAAVVLVAYLNQRGMMYFPIPSVWRRYRWQCTMPKRSAFPPATVCSLSPGTGRPLLDSRQCCTFPVMPGQSHGDQSG